MNLKYHAIQFLFLAFTSRLMSQDLRWVEAEALVSMANRTQEQARFTALTEARADAVRKVVGTKIHTENFRVQSETSDGRMAAVVQDFFTSVNRDVAYGQVVDEETIYEGVETYDVEPGRPQLYYRVRIKAQVAQEKGEPDPSFAVHVKTNKMIYLENEEMTIDLQATQDCYVYVFNVLANDSLIVLFPNRYMQDNHLRADHPLHLMPVGFGLEVTLLPGFQRAQELIYVVATKGRFDFEPNWQRGEEAFHTAATPAFALIELPRWLANIPLDKRTDRVVSYEVYRPAN